MRQLYAGFEVLNATPHCLFQWRLAPDDRRHHWQALFVINATIFALIILDMVLKPF